MKEATWTVNDLDRRVIINTRTAEVADADTKYVDITWSSDNVVFANVIEQSPSKEKEVLGGIVYDSVLTVVIRYKSAYKEPKNRLKYENKYYDIIDAREVYGRKRWLVLKCVYAGKQLHR